MKIILCAFLFTLQAQASVLLKDIGVMGLASHDMFTWDRVNEVNLENGRLDLSTIFDYESGKRWKKGGNPKNAENAPVYTVTMNLVKSYKAFIKEGLSESDARKATVKAFHHMVRESYSRMTGFHFPQSGLNESVTNTEQAAMRGLHDILPGRVKLFDRIGRRELNVTNVWFAKTRLNEKEMNQEIAFYNGDYDLEYQAIKIPFSRKVINLKKVDAEFIDKFSPYSQDEMLSELKLMGEGKISSHDVKFMQHLKELFAKGICPVDDNWMPEVSCH